ncbi:hypothetical protein AC93_5023 [Escherichia coli 2-005-03_S4_C2]|jgi:hypothetical protein|nr:hypothetical protein AD23_1529 [Escherichia coli 2-005-03_S4_C3]EZJ63930.1 hypothetical protein AC93_5023 [Escherichia coli 2-005-03_S4_C2]
MNHQKNGGRDIRHEAKTQQQNKPDIAPVTFVTQLQALCKF